jgi:serine/threonine protein kinase
MAVLLDMTARVRTEVELHCKLRHDHVVRVLDIDEDNGHIFMMLEYVALGNLQSYIQQRIKRPLTEIEARSVIKQV